MPRRKPVPAAVALELFGGFAEELEAPQAPAAPALELDEAAPSRDGGIAFLDEADYREAAEEAAASSVAVLELREFPIRWFLELPLGSRLELELEGEAFVVATDKAAHGRALEEGVPTFAGGELLAIALAAKNDRLFGNELRDELARKRANPKHRTTPQAVLGALPVERCEPLEGFTFRDLEARLRVELVDVAIG